MTDLRATALDSSRDRACRHTSHGAGLNRTLQIAWRPKLPWPCQMNCRQSLIVTQTLCILLTYFKTR